jgi:hypothetical protein
MSSTLDGWPIVTPKSIFQSQKKSMFPILLGTNLYGKDHMYPIHSKGMKKEKVVP